MLKQHSAFLRRALIVGDLIIVAISFLLGYFLRSQILYIFGFRTVYPLREYLGLLPILLIIWGFLLQFFKLYNSLRVQSISETVLILAKTTTVSFLLFSSVLYILRIEQISRALIILVFFVASTLIMAEKVILIECMRIARKKGFNFKNVLIIGTGKRAQLFIDLLSRHPEWGLRIIGLVDDHANMVGQLVKGHKVIGVLDDMPRIVHKHVIDDVVFVVPRTWLTKVQGVVHFCEVVGLRISVAVDYFDLKFSRAQQFDLAGFPLLTFESAPNRVWHLLLKRIIDITVSALGLIVLSPLFLAIVILIKRTSKGSAFFKQKRSNLNGRTFSLYKFRTMVVGAEAKLEELKHLNEMTGPAFKLEDDPRITSIGRFLRKWSLDELPQLWNVLQGHMSLVGPRPPLPSEVKKYDHWHRRRLSMRPGLTCLWQVSGRNKITDFDEWMKLDLQYIDNWSLWLDIKIILKTIPAVLLRVGAK